MRSTSSAGIPTDSGSVLRRVRDVVRRDTERRLVLMDETTMRNSLSRTIGA